MRSILAKLKRNTRKFRTISFTAIGVLGVTGSILMQAYAATINTSPAAKVSFTFDDGLTSAATQAAPTLQKYGLTATDYVITGCVGMTTAPNTCHANTDASYMTWDQINQLKNTYGWEIGAHTVTHPYLASFDASDGQPNPLTMDQVKQELTQSKADLATHGITATDMATPYGDYNMPVLAEIAKNYQSQRGFADTGYNGWPNSDYLIREQQVQGGVSVATVKSYIDSAIANKQWLVLVFHDIMTNASTNPDDYQYSTSNLDQIAAYVKSKSLPAVNVTDGLVKSDVNLLPNASFNSGISGGWTTDSANVSGDGGNNGSYPDPLNSVKMVGGTQAVHLFSPKITVDPSTTYMLKSFLNVQKITSGEVGYYIDEYDANGNWVSGQFKAAEHSVFVEEMNFSYKPTSANVRSASLQVYTTANSGVTAYLDNAQWFPLTTGTVTPANLALNHPATSSSVSGTGFEAAKAVDGNSGTSWNSVSRTDPQWLQIDLGSTTNINQVTVNWVSSNYAKSYQIQVSNDATNWTNIYSTTSGTGGTNDLTGLSGSGRYVRIYGTARSARKGSYSLSEVSVYGTATTVPAPTTDLMTNGNFDTGISNGWTTDSATSVTADNQSNGSVANPINSVKITSAATNVHLFSPKITVDSTKTYSLSAFLNLKARTSGETGFYIDEYDANGNWISGQWKLAVTSLGSGTFQISYKPTSANVKQSSLQIYTTANSGITAYVDDVKWLQ
ncbi:MAG TPA: discoidin domain-containing protein [Candidatus Saccharimonadales bacterium]|nr:discoidin domain-containing protein [Candidatus Saccharimonadales bacterium]